MNTRRPFTVAAAALLALCFADSAIAQSFPSKPLRIIVPYAAGGVNDGLARTLAAGMKDELGQAVVVENRAGAAGIVGMQSCALAPPDGYTICMTVQDSLSFNPYLFSSLPYDAKDGFTPITNLGWTNGLIVVSAKSGIQTYQEMIAAAKASPGKLNWATWGEASQPDILLRAIASHENINITPIPYKGAGQSNPAILSGEVDLTYMGIGNAMQHIESGRLKPLALTGRQRVASLPGIPTLTELGADTGLAAYFAAFGPAKIPGPILDRLYSAIVKSTQTPAAQQFYKNYTLTFVGDTPAKFAEFVKADQANAVRTFKQWGFKPENTPSQ
jgi:tripartite-type tricarboxylate transporter receptor subunit TctC